MIVNVLLAACCGGLLAASFTTGGTWGLVCTALGMIVGGVVGFCSSLGDHEADKDPGGER